jgi:superfamily II DNA or RNA helicase
MLNTCISSFGYGILKKDNEELINKLKEDLTVSPRININISSQVKTFSLYLESKTYLYIPKNYGFDIFGEPQNNKLEEPEETPRLEFKGELREKQKKIVEAFINSAKDPLKRGGIISAKCGEGKTVMAVYISCYLKKKTLFIVHKEFLGDQVKDCLKQFAPDAKIGIIKQSKVDVENKDFIIASLQSLAMKDYDKEIFKKIGLVIIDECHHTGAEIFSRALKKINAPITLGLSATLNRKDGLRKVFEYYLGKPVIKNVKEKKDMIVQMHKYYVSDYNYSHVQLLWNGNPNSAKMVNSICEYTPRTLMIIDIIKNILNKEPDRQILILSERRGHLVDFEKYLKEDNITSVGYYVGGMNINDLKKSETKQIILATFQMASEGMDIPTLNTLILASPYTSIEQSIGRIQRQKPEERKYIPLTIDIWDNFSIFDKKGYSRKKFYDTNKYMIELYDCGKLIEPEKINKKIEFIDEDD